MKKKANGKTIKVRFFNVVIQPAHKQNEDNYKALINEIFSKGYEYITAPDKKTKMRSLNTSSDMVFGTLVNYMKLDTDDLWYNSANDDFEQVDVDPNLNPKGKEWEYYFYPKTHRIAIPSKRGVSHGQIYNFFSKAFKDAANTLGFEDAAVNIVTSSEGIEAIFNLTEIEKLTVEVSYSNNDNNDAFDQAIDDQLKDMNIGKLKTTAQPPKNSRFTLKKDSYLGALVRLCKNNGWAKAEGRVMGHVKKVNTDQYPKEFELKKVTDENILQKITEAIKSIL